MTTLNIIILNSYIQTFKNIDKFVFQGIIWNGWWYSLDFTIISSVALI